MAKTSSVPNAVVTIAILGASGHIGRTLALALPQTWHLDLFTAHPEVARRFGDDHGLDVRILPYGQLSDRPYDLIINAAGPGDPTILASMAGQLFAITDHYDTAVLEVLERRPDTGYIYISSGSIYGTDYSTPVGDDTAISIMPNRIEPRDYYRLSKLLAEAKHRAQKHLKIADIRVFGYFSRYIDPNSGFFLSEVARCLAADKPLVTPPHDFVRDIVSAEDLAHLIITLLAAGVPNGPYDAISAKPTTKFEILDQLSRDAGLIVEGEPQRLSDVPGTMSFNRRATDLGYKPRLNSLELVTREIIALRDIIR